MWGQEAGNKQRTSKFAISLQKIIMHFKSPCVRNENNDSNSYENTTGSIHQKIKWLIKDNRGLEVTRYKNMNIGYKVSVQPNYIKSMYSSK